MSFRAGMAVGFLALAGALLGVACDSTPTPVEPTAGTGAGPGPSGPKACGKLPSAINLVASSRVRAMIGSRRSVGIIPVKVQMTDECQIDVTVLDQCQGAGFYSYKPYSGKHRTKIKKLDDINGEVPLRDEDYARLLEGGAIVLSDEVYVGTYERTTSEAFAKQMLKGNLCTDATHFVSKVYVGGFAMANGPAADLEKLDSVFYSQNRMVFSQEGDPQGCEKGSSTRSVNEVCSVPLRIELSEFGVAPPPLAHDPCEAGDKLDKKSSTCVEAVCDAVSYCCTSHWDAGCINKAKQICPNPCTNCAHKLCEVGEKLDPLCNPCVQKVCAQDSYCCNNTWDKSCTQKVASACGFTKDELLKQGCSDKPVCTGGQFNDPVTGVCKCGSGQNWNGSSCITPPPPASCHDVCETGPRQMASCDPCVKKICEKDAFCCNNSWDTGCKNKVKTVCGKFCKGDLKGGPGPGPGSTKKNNGAGCNSNSECKSGFCNAVKGNVCDQPQ